MSGEDYMRLPGAWDVRHWLRIPALRHDADGKTIEAGPGGLSGVRGIRVFVARRKIRVLYDQTKLDYQSIKERLEAIGFPVANTWWWNQKGSWFQYLDCNARENANAPPAPCCSNPKGLERSSGHHS